MDWYFIVGHQLDENEEKLKTSQVCRTRIRIVMENSTTCSRRKKELKSLARWKIDFHPCTFTSSKNNYFPSNKLCFQPHIFFSRLKNFPFYFTNTIQAKLHLAGEIRTTILCPICMMPVREKQEETEKVGKDKTKSRFVSNYGMCLLHKRYFNDFKSNLVSVRNA